MSTSTFDLLVMGLDLATGQEVHIDDAPLSTWHAKSYLRGDGTLICLHCHLGDQAAEGTVVPLVVRGRYRGARRAHFAHPPGMAPVGGHSPETLWHSTGKRLITEWASSLPHVANTRTEQRVLEGRRRADVLVSFVDGQELAIEIQHQILPDPDWLARHRSYAERGISDVWFWHPGIKRLPRIVLREGQPLWRLDVETARLAIGYGAPHHAGEDWYRVTDPAIYDWHYPPCPSDEIAFVSRPLRDFRLAKDGVLLPEDVAQLLENERKERRAEAEAEANRRHAITGAPNVDTVLCPGDTPTVCPPQRGWSATRIDCY